MAGGRETVALPSDSQETEPGRATSEEVVRFDLPTPNSETQPYWDAARNGRLLIKRCADCGRAHSWSVVYRNDLPPFHERVPYVAAVVDLEEGPRMMTNVVDTDVDALRVGMPLEVDFRPVADAVALPVFRAVAAA